MDKRQQKKLLKKKAEQKQKVNPDLQTQEPYCLTFAQNVKLFLWLHYETKVSVPAFKSFRERFEVGSDNYVIEADGLKKFFNCSDREVKIVMDMFDINRDYKIDAYEFMCAMAFMSHGTLDQKAQLIFSLYDFDKSGLLSLDEMTALMTNSIASLNAMEGKGKPSIAQIEQKTKELFKDIDKDGNRRISIKEFQEFIRTDRQILGVLVNNELTSREDLGTNFGSKDEEIPELDMDLEEEINPSGLKQSKKVTAAKKGHFMIDEVDQNEAFTEQQSFQTIKTLAPTNYKYNKQDGSSPDSNLELDYIYGFRCRDVRNNLHYSHNGEKIIWHVGSIGIVYEKKSNTQTFFRSHNDDIHCIARHPNPDKTLVATGQIGDQPMLCVWNYETKEVVLRVSTPVTHGIKHISFSHDGNYIVASAMDEKHSLVIYEWEQKEGFQMKPLVPIAAGFGPKEAILSIGFDMENTQIVVTCVREIWFYTFENNVIKGKRGQWGKKGAQTTLCHCYVKQHLFTGFFNGKIGAWDSNFLLRQAKAHDGRVNGLHSIIGQNKIVSGGQDGISYIWKVVEGANLIQINKYDLNEPQIRSMCPKVTSICRKVTQDDTNSILVGTRGGEIVEFNEKTRQPTVHQRGHYDVELKGLTVHPYKAEAYTFGRDGLLGVWDLSAHRQHKYAQLDTPGDVIQFSNKGEFLILGMHNGTLLVLDKNLQPVTKRVDRRGQRITCVKCSPRDKICAVGSTDSQVFCYDIQNKWVPLQQMCAASESISHIDFSTDGIFMKIQSQDHQVYYYNVETGKRDRNDGSYNDVKWENPKCTLAWELQGIWQQGMDGNDIHAICLSNDRTTVATADSFGYVSLFRYPCPVSEAAFNKNRGHSCHVANLAFSKNSHGPTYLISVGYQDKCIFQWKYNFDFESAQESAQQKMYANVPTPLFDDGMLDMNTYKDDVQEQVRLQSLAMQIDKLNQNLCDQYGIDFNPLLDDDKNTTEYIYKRLTKPANIKKYCTRCRKWVHHQYTKHEQKCLQFIQWVTMRPDGLLVAEPVKNEALKENFQNKKNQIHDQRKELDVVHCDLKIALDLYLHENPQLIQHQEDKDPVYDPDSLLEIPDKDRIGQSNLVARAFQEQPTKYKESSLADRQPDQNLKLKHVHGFRSFDTRGNLRYTADGRILFSTAGVGIVQNLKNEQQFFTLHGDDIISMDLHPNGDYVATGDLANNEGTNLNETDAQEQKLVRLLVWKASTQEIVTEISGFQRRALKFIRFSPSGRKILTIGGDTFNTVALYDWVNNIILASQRIDPEGVYDVAWKDNHEFTTVGKKHIIIFQQIGANLLRTRIPYIEKMGNYANTSVNYIGKTKILVTGNQRGSLYWWKNKKPKRITSGHIDAIWQIKANEGRIQMCTGCNGGIIIGWSVEYICKVHGSLQNNSCPCKIQNHSYEFEVMFMFNMASIDQGCSASQVGIRSLDCSKVETQQLLLVGTRGSEVSIIDTFGELKHRVIQGHSPCQQDYSTYPEVWGLSCHSTEQLFATCGSDGTVKVWMVNRMIKQSAKLPFDPTAVDFSPNGRFLAIGDRSGQAYLLNYDTMQPTEGKITSKSAKDYKRLWGSPWIQSMTVCPDSTKIVFGAHGSGYIELGVVSPSLKLSPLCKPIALGLQVPTQMDWSTDSNFIHISAGEPLCFNLSNRKQAFLSQMKDIEWATWSQILGWGVQGIWHGYTINDINSTARSHNHKVVATADDYSRIKIFKWPCIKDKANHKTYYGHSSHVTKVRFSAGDNFLASVGGGDQSFFIWETDFGIDGSSRDEKKENEEIKYEPHPNDPVFEFDKKDRSKILKAKQREQKLKKEHEQTQLQIMSYNKNELGEELKEGDDFVAVKPWKGKIREPSGFKRPPLKQEFAPTISLEIDWVYGYRGSMCKNNIGLLSDGSIAYFAAGLGIVYNHGREQRLDLDISSGVQITDQKKTQRYFDKHNDDITCIAFCKNRKIIATGENGQDPTVHIWDGLNVSPKFACQGNGIIKSVICLAFSPSGKTLGIIAGNRDHNIAIYNAENGQLIATSKGSRSNIVDMAFEDEYSFVTVGSKHYKIWSVSNGAILSKNGLFGSRDQRIGSIAFNGKQALTGEINGNVYKWENGNIIDHFKNHSQLVDTITVTEEFVFTGGRDCRVVMLDKQTYEVIIIWDFSNEININQDLQSESEESYLHNISKITLKDSQCPQIRGIQFYQDKLIVGTLSHEIYFQEEAGFVPITQSHYAPNMNGTNEVAGLDIVTDSSGDNIITCSEDGTLRMFNQQQKRQTLLIDLTMDSNNKKIPLDNTRSKEAKAEREYLLTKTGNLSAQDAKQSEERAIDLLSQVEQGEMTHQVQGKAVAISQDLKLIVVGMKDGNLRFYFYDQEEKQLFLDYESRKISKKEISVVKFSPDHTKLVVAAGKYLYLFDFKKIHIDNKTKPKRFGESESFITAVDWSEDGKALRTIDCKYEYFFYDVSTFKEEPDGFVKYRDNEWYTQTCTLGWGVQGIWQPEQSGDFINTVAFQRYDTLGLGYRLLATGDDDSMVNVYRYPSCVEESKFVQGQGHSSHVTKVQFSDLNPYLYSLGGNDTSLIQWRLNLKQ